jgi:hypothetical protein
MSALRALMSALRALAGATLVLVCALVAFGAAQEDSPGARLRRAAAELSAALEPEQREAALYAFDDEERFDLRLAPVLLDGLALRDMGERERGALDALLAAGLSPAGLAKLRSIMSLETEVARLDRERGFPGGWFSRVATPRDPEAYYLTLYGDPAADGPFAFRFDGHHVSLSFSAIAAGGVPASTPIFLGAQPRRVRDGWERAGLEVLAEEESLARALYRSLEPAARARATLPFAADRELMLGTERRLGPLALAAGLSRAELGAAQASQLDALLEAYLGLLDPQIAAARRAEIDAAGRDALRFAWAGSAAPGEPHYYRLQGPGFLIEFDNSLPGADHIHVLWRDPARDYGMDLLAAHHRLSD